ncbi:tRNA (N6-isopentenyl adenosine(37)-C2)-methylthiotransferase MiaB [Thermosediminibacter oceani]|uniref:tRNA-2-methylthio-N(6)-dimethylallyladenosine synthase n=1 Tax=Thermosediminibacter oceani (strain ATCC BAA-1034 / DSM 16646 / JW/IW-1228P) TaxID=555079 RepID=D9S3H1_THEOJ|nr:tRNA (N6-isopentenyl adenosine(37)-C2)-methylthiotransferase MiaB [Thermosediminibacter oceani]ADL07948.1 tRNA-i(6)A37 thiotransferase enzyme MiaB [Thermosediminibacter oceani DSM 16646]
MLKYHILTWGCQMNLHDTEVISGVLQKMGYCPAGNLKEADLIILNTCCVRENAERKVYGRIGQLKQFKQRNPNLVLGICGCMIQQPHVVEYITEHFPYVDLIFGIHNVHKLPQLIENARLANMTVIETGGESSQIEEDLPVEREDKIKAWVTITYGCNNFCTYCIVPYVRGREKSRNPEDIVREVEELAKQGFKEINLLGQNVNSYGKDLGGAVTFPELLRRLNDIDGIERIRFTTSHPKDLSDELIYAMRDCKKVCEHIHLPVQAGSNRILEAMNRRYTREHYMELVKKLRDAISDIAISTDIIVGFPGETEEDFQDTLDLVRRVEYDQAFMFVYSKRKGTPAAEMENQVDEDVKKERLDRLMRLQDSISAKKNKALKGQVVEVLVEGPSRNNPEKLTGRTRTNKVVNFEGPADLIGKLVEVRITEPHTWSLIGEVLK